MRVYQTWLHAQDDKDFAIFHVVDSETQHLPIGKLRDHWSQNALKEKDKEVKSSEDFYRKDVIEAASSIREKYGEVRT